MDSAGVVLIVGVMAAGKSTIAALLAETFPRAAHVRGDVFRRSISSGRVDPTPDMPPAAWEQLRLRYRLMTTTADLYAEHGFVAVAQDVVIGPVLADVLDMIRSRPLRLVVLDPDPAAVAAREAQRSKAGYSAPARNPVWDPSGLVSALRTTTPRIGLWLDTSRQTPEETVSTIRQRFDDALVEPGNLEKMVP